MAKYWTSSKHWTTTINSSTRYLVGSSGGKCNYQTIGAGSTKRILQSNGSNKVLYANLTIPVPSGSQTFKSSGTFTVPAGVTRVTVFCVGGGAGSIDHYSFVNSSGNGVYKGSGGGGGGYTKTATITVSPGQRISYTVGAGGARATRANANAGGTTTFSSCSASGGKGARYATNNLGSDSGGEGGSGGGGGQGVGGTANTGGGAGGGSDSNTNGSAGGSGIILVKWG